MAQTVSADFDNAVVATSRTLRHSVKIAWERTNNPSLIYAVVGTTKVGDDDIIQGESSILSPADFFQFDDETNYAFQLSYDRKILEPLGGIAYALVDLLLVNTDQRFSPDVDPTIGSSILPNRPVKLYTGFHYFGDDHLVPVFVGLSEIPEEDKAARLVRIPMFDYMKELDQAEISTKVYKNQRSDQIIDDILTQLGFSSSQYSLDTGLNTIDFIHFPAGTKAAEAIRVLCEAEEGFFYQDEFGMLRFENRRHYNQSPHNSYIWTIENDHILHWEDAGDVGIINFVQVRAKPLEVGDVAEIYKLGATLEIQQNTTETYFADMENPVDTVITPVANTDYTANTNSDGSGTDVTSFVSITTTALGQRIKLEIQNTYLGRIYITSLTVRGTPAVVLNPIEQEYEDSASQAIYGTKSLIIENDAISSSSFAYYLARAIVNKYKDPLRRIRITVRAIPQLQLKDRIRVYDPDIAGYTEYRVMRIQATMSVDQYLMTLTLREISDLEADTPAIVGTSTVDGDDVVWI